RTAAFCFPESLRAQCAHTADFRPYSYLFAYPRRRAGLSHARTRIRVTPVTKWPAAGVRAPRLAADPELDQPERGPMRTVDDISAGTKPPDVACTRVFAGCPESVSAARS